MNEDENEILKHTHHIVDIELRKDADALESYLDDEYLGVDPSGALIDKHKSVRRYRSETFHL
jgi:hypothetical protein